MITPLAVAPHWQNLQFLRMWNISGTSRFMIVPISPPWILSPSHLLKFSKTPFMKFQQISRLPFLAIRIIPTHLYGNTQRKRSLRYNHHPLQQPETHRIVAQRTDKRRNAVWHGKYEATLQTSYGIGRKLVCFWNCTLNRIATHHPQSQISHTKLKFKKVSQLSQLSQTA